MSHPGVNRQWQLMVKFKNSYFVGIIIGIFVLIVDFSLFRETTTFVPLIIIALTIGWAMPWLDYFQEGLRRKEIETRFLDFVRNLAGAIKSGMPVSRSITHISKMDYGSLSPYVRKLGHQVEWAIPVHKAMLFFSNSTKSDIIRRAIATVIEAEQSGGNMEDVLTSITESLIEIKKIKEQRRASVHSQIVQSYIIFFIFIGVMLVVQNMLVPYLVGGDSGDGSALFSSSGGSALGGISAPSTGSSSSLSLVVDIKFDSLGSFVRSLSKWFVSLRGVFVMLSLIQGFFAGIIIGKMAEGDLTNGLKHSLILMTVALFVMSMVKMG
jgi:archaeal flagellar protein FlaJ